MALSFKQKLLLVILAAVTLTTVLLGTSSYSLLKEETQQTILSEVRASAHNTSTHLMDWLEAKNGVIEALAETLPPQEEVKPHLYLAEQSGHFDLVYLGTSGGDMLVSSPTELPEDYDPRVRPWYKGAQQAGGLYLTEPYVDAFTGTMIISIAKPVNRNGVRGVVGSDITMKDVLADVLSQKLRWDGRILLANREARFMAHPDQSLLLKPVSQVIPDLSAGRMRRLAQTDTLTTVQTGQREQLLYVQQIPGTDWYQLLLVDQEQATAPLRQLLLETVLYGGLVLVLVFICVYFIAQRLTLPLLQLSTALHDIALGEGDLTRRLQVHSDTLLGGLARDFNRFMESMQTTAKSLTELSKRLARDAETGADLSRRNSEEVRKQQTELAQVAAAVHEVSAATGEIATNAEQAAASAQHAAESTREGTQVVADNREAIQQLAQQVNDAAGVIGDLDQHAQDITTILATIRDIAEQTNMLALNAAIEAARAGEHGRGFAVVADEVRELSQRTHQSTEEIQKMIENLQGSTGKAVDMMNRSEQMAHASVENAITAARRLEQIDGANSTISDMATQIASAVEEQNAVTNEISSNTEVIKQVSDELADQAQQAQNQSGELSSLATDLKREVSRFKV